MPTPRTFDPVVFTSKTVFLQRIQSAVGDGYAHYVTGTVPPAAMAHLARKFASYYAVHCDKNERFRRKKEGLGNARLLLYLNAERSVDFVLLVTLGVNPAHELERLTDVKREPLHLREYELVLLTLKGRSKPGLTWRLTAATLEGWRERLRLATAHGGEAELRQCWWSLYRTAGFAGVRRQVGELVSFWRKAWAREQGDKPCPIEFSHNDMAHRRRPGIVQREGGRTWTVAGFPSPAQCPKLFYVRMQRDKGIRLRRLVSGLDAEREQALQPAAQSAKIPE